MRESHCTEHTQSASLSDSSSLTELTAIWRTAGTLARQVVSELVTEYRNNPTKISNHERPKSRTLRLLCMCTTTSAPPCALPGRRLVQEVHHGTVKSVTLDGMSSSLSGEKLSTIQVL